MTNKRTCAGVIPEGTGDTAPTLFDALCDARQWVALLALDQQFMFLRGVLYQWALDHGESVMELEALFTDDIRYMSQYAQVVTPSPPKRRRVKKG